MNLVESLPVILCCFHFALFSVKKLLCHTCSPSDLYLYGIKNRIISTYSCLVFFFIFCFHRGIEAFFSLTKNYACISPSLAIFVVFMKELRTFRKRSQVRQLFLFAMAKLDEAKSRKFDVRTVRPPKSVR